MTPHRSPSLLETDRPDPGPKGQLIVQAGDYGPGVGFTEGLSEYPLDPTAFFVCESGERSRAHSLGRASAVLGEEPLQPCDLRHRHIDEGLKAT
ncbi:hypothetical protein ABIB58_001386 [Brevundimonas sp. UYEF29]|uniref:hypothetical protein n=1 Tax=unclassified Brevundimonas TaxID=2622653 RepID=UPI00339902A3